MASDSTIDGFLDINSNGTSKFINNVGIIIDALKKFENSYDKKFNFDKLMNHMKVPKKDRCEFALLIIKFQELFNSTFNSHAIKKKVIKGQIYLVAEKKSTKKEVVRAKIDPPSTIKVLNSEAKLLSDIIYVFTHVKRGKGFDPQGKTELSKNIITLRNKYPYLFYANGGNLVYPSELGLELGIAILSYSKNKKRFEEITVKNIHVRFIEDE